MTLSHHTELDDVQAMDALSESEVMLNEARRGSTVGREQCRSIQIL